MRVGAFLPVLEVLPFPGSGISGGLLLTCTVFEGKLWQVLPFL